MAGAGGKMKVDDIKLYYEYNEWANKRILNAAKGVSLGTVDDAE